MNDVKFQIVEHIGVLSDDKIITELNLVEWGNRKPTYDLRRWKLDDGAEVPYKGITLSVDELRALRDILDGMEVLDNEET